MKIDVPGQSSMIKYYEPDTQAMLQMEECTRLVEAIGAMRRASLYGIDNGQAYNALVEGMADALICLEQLQELYDVSNFELQDLINRKCRRMRDQISKR